jgi:two-component system response regulator DesR
MIRVMVIEDHVIVAEGVGVALSREPDLKVVATARSASAGIAAARRTRPDVALVEHGMSATVVTAELLVDLPLLVVIPLPTSYRATKLADVIRRCAAGEAAALIASLSELATSPAPSSLGLSEREVEVLRLVADGLDARGIAHALGLSVHTVRGHVQSVLEKTGTHTKVEAVMRGLEAGLL